MPVVDGLCCLIIRSHLLGMGVYRGGRSPEFGFGMLMQIVTPDFVTF